MNINNTAFLWSLLCCLAGLQVSARAQIPAYSEIEKSEIWTLNQDFTVSYKVSETIMVTDIRGLYHGTIVVPFDELSRIMSFEAKLIDPKNGKIIQKVTPKNLSEYNRVSDISLFEDDKVKVFYIDTDKVPIQIEVSYEIRQIGNFYFNRWLPTPEYFNQRLKSAKLEFNYPAELGLNYIPTNTSIQPDSTYANGVVTLQWKSEDVPAQDKSSSKDYPYVIFAPKKFSLQGYASDMSTWEGFAKWQALLNKDKDDLPEAAKMQILSMIQDKHTDFEKIDTLYRYLQQNYRYVSIQLGIGGWMPKPASEVFANKYGECKGLSNLMKSMLRLAGIDAQYTIVRAGTDAKDINIDIPHSQFNHIILRVPLENEVVWLECTSKTLPTGYLGEFTKNRHVLVVTEDGGFIDKTPAYDDVAYNTYHFQHTYELKNGGDALVEAVYDFQGNPAARWLEVSKSLDNAQKKNYLNARLGGTGLLVSDFSIEQTNIDFMPRARVRFEGQIQKFSQSTSKRIIVPISWKKLSADMVENGRVSISENFWLGPLQDLELEGNAPQLDIKENLFEFRVHTVIEGDRLKVEKNTLISPPQDYSKEDKEKLLQKANQQINKSIIFKKPELHD